MLYPILSYQHVSSILDNRLNLDFNLQWCINSLVQRTVQQLYSLPLLQDILTFSLSCTHACTYIRCLQTCLEQRFCTSHEAMHETCESRHRQKNSDISCFTNLNRTECREFSREPASNKDFPENEDQLSLVDYDSRENQQRHGNLQKSSSTLPKKKLYILQRLLNSSAQSFLHSEYGV